jgi:hypothetical protein
MFLIEAWHTEPGSEHRLFWLGVVQHLYWPE